MKKSHRFDELSDKGCRVCGKKLKKRLVETKDPYNIDHCYNHEPQRTISGHSIRKEAIVA